MMSTSDTPARTTFLSGSAVDLVLLEERDAPNLMRWINDHAVTRFLARGDQPMTERDEIAWVNELYNRPRDLTLGIWHRADATLMGTIGLHTINQRDQHATLGIMIGEQAYWGRGYGRDAISTLLEYAFTIRNLRQVDLRVLGNNPRGQRCYERCGFVHVGTLPQRTFKDGQWHDELIMVAWRTNN